MLNKHPTHTALHTFLERMKLRYVIALGAMTVLAASGAYYFLTLTGHGGLKDAIGSVDYWDALYFSVVTFTSLGYGDISPIGAARLVACVEVMLGLALFGLAVAKVSAARQGYYLTRLYVNDATERLSYYEQSLRDVKLRYRQTTAAIGERAAFESLNSRLHGILHSLVAYIDFETSKGDFFGEISPFPVVKMLRQMAKTIREVDALRRKCLADQINQEAAESARRRLEQARDASALIRASSVNQDILDACSVVDKVCGGALQ